MTGDRTSHLTITSQTQNHQATEPTMKNSRSDSLLILKCDPLFQMTKQSYHSLFTMRIDFIVCNFD